MNTDDDATSIDPFSLIEQLLVGNDLSEDERDLVQRVHEHLLRIVAHFNDDDEITGALAAVFRYGIAVGRYVKLREPETLAEIERLRAKVGGHASGMARQPKWHEEAKAFAIKYDASEELTRVELAEKIREALGQDGPAVETIGDLLKEMVRKGELSRKKR
jgi:hypothetical protein